MPGDCNFSFFADIGVYICLMQKMSPCKFRTIVIDYTLFLVS